MPGDEQPPIVDGHAAGPALGPEHAALADALRAVTDQIVRTQASSDQLAAAATLVAQAAELLESATPPFEVSLPAGVATDADPHAYFPFSPVIGRFTPLAPPLEFTVEDGVVHGRGTYGAAFEGPPGCVHGGTVAQMLDELLGVANIVAGVPAMTGTLTVKYRSPTPLFRELRLEGHSAHWERRKVRARGTIHVGDTLCAEAEGIFVMADFPTFERHMRGE